MKREINLNRNFVVYLFIIAVIAVTGYYSYALFQVNVISDNAVVVLNTGNITIGVANGDVTLTSGQQKNVTITLSNNRDINVAYKLYYESSSNLEVVDLSGLSEGEMSATKSITLSLKNNSSSTRTITIKAKGGLIGDTIRLGSGQQGLTALTLGSPVSNCYTTSNFYEVNPNMNENETNTCINYLGTELGFNNYLKEDETINAFCKGFGTINGQSFAYMVNDDFNSTELEYMQNNNIITKSNTSVSITNYDSNCSNEVVIPEKINDKNVVYIAKNAFTGKNITSVTIPNSVAMIGKMAFNSTTNLTDITVLWANPIVLVGDEFSYNDSIKLHVPTGSINKYQTADFWSSFNIEES